MRQDICPSKKSVGGDRNVENFYLFVQKLLMEDEVAQGAFAKTCLFSENCLECFECKAAGDLK